MNNQQQKLQILTQVAELCEKNLTPIQLAMYMEALKEYSAEEVKRALFTHIKNPEGGQFMPKPADVVKQLTGGTQTQALLAWTKVDWAVRCIGTNASVCFEDSLIHQVILDMGGWVSLGSKNNDEWPFVKNEFEKRYRGYLISTLPQIFPERLIGAHDHISSLNGMSDSETRFIQCETRLALEKRKVDQANQPALKKYHHLEDKSNGCTLPIGSLELN